MRSGPLLIAALVAGLAIPANALVPAVPAAASDRAPQVGDCFDLSDSVLQEGGWWPDVEPVPCTTPHTYEVTQVGLLPQDVDAFAFARDQCSALAVWTAVGVNQPVAGIVTDPVRIEPRSFGVRRQPAAWVCGAVAVDFNGRSAPTAVQLDSPVEGLARRSTAGLRHCSSAADGRRALAPPITVTCSTRPRWQARTWIVWTAFYDDDPGRAELRARAAQLCGARAVASLPNPADWDEGLPITRCHLKYP